MGSRETLLLALAIVSAFPFLSTTGATETAFDAGSWGMIVACDNEIHFFKNDTEIWKSTVANISHIRGLAYDSVNRTLYFTDEYFILYSSDLVEENLDPKLKFNRILDTGDSEIHSLVFDPVTKTLFWSQVGALMKMEVASYGIDSAPKISKLHDFTGVYYSTLDICHRFIYWVNRGDRGSSIERSRLDGSDREVILTIDSPAAFLGLTVDHYRKKLYFGTAGEDWHGDIEIEESNLDGTDRRVLANITDENVFLSKRRLAVDDTAIYWPGHSHWEIIAGVYKNGTAMKAIKTSSSQVRCSHAPSNVLTRHTVEGIDCKAVLDKQQTRTLEELLAHNQSQVAARLEQLSNKVDTFVESK